MKSYVRKLQPCAAPLCWQAASEISAAIRVMCGRLATVPVLNPQVFATPETKLRHSMPTRVPLIEEQMEAANKNASKTLLSRGQSFRYAHTSQTAIAGASRRVRFSRISSQRLLLRLVYLENAHQPGQLQYFPRGLRQAVQCESAAQVARRLQSFH